MKTPICDICIKSGMLCPACQKHLESGRISPRDVELSQHLYALVKEGTLPDTISLLQTFEIDDTVVVVVPPDDVGTLIGRGGKIVKQLQKAMHLKLRVVAQTTDARRIVHDLLYPAKVVAVNKLYLPDGTIRKKMRIRTEGKKKLPMNLKTVTGIIERMTAETVEIVTE